LKFLDVLAAAELVFLLYVLGIDVRMFQLEMLLEGAFRAIGLATIKRRTLVLPFDFRRGSSKSLNVDVISKSTLVLSPSISKFHSSFSSCVCLHFSKFSSLSCNVFLSPIAKFIYRVLGLCEYLFVEVSVESLHFAKLLIVLEV